jgi:hypothetical protein
MGVVGISELRLGSDRKGDENPVGGDEHDESPDRSWWRVQLKGRRTGGVGVQGSKDGQDLCSKR